ncbi:MAG TPA: sugar ABC transporter permease [Methanomicrobiales archaeon]|nr:sugar ABC transporter permease [Methanomicrobiales archaeon]
MHYLFRKIRRRLSRSNARTDGGTSSGKNGFLDSDFIRSMPYCGIPFALMALAVYGAIGWNFLISFTDMQGFGQPDYSHLSLHNYVAAFTNTGPPPIWHQLQNTIVLLVVFTTLCLAIGLVLAIMLDRKIRFKNTFRSIYLLPMSLSFVVTAQFWLWMYNNSHGIINTILKSIGISNPPHWIGNPSLSLGAVIFALIWQFSGYAMVVYLAGLRSIPSAQFEAARIDGATTARMYWRVIIPQLRASTVSAAVVLMVFALKAFSFLYALTGGFNPPAGTDILATKMVRAAFKKLNWSYGAAIGVILFALALAVIGPYLATQYRRGAL